MTVMLEYRTTLQHPNTTKWVLFISSSSLLTMELAYLPNNTLLNGSRKSKVLSQDLYEDMHGL